MNTTLAVILTIIGCMAVSLIFGWLKYQLIMKPLIKSLGEHFSGVIKMLEEEKNKLDAEHTPEAYDEAVPAKSEETCPACDPGTPEPVDAPEAPAVPEAPTESMPETPAPEAPEAPQPDTLQA